MRGILALAVVLALALVLIWLGFIVDRPSDPTARIAEVAMRGGRSPTAAAQPQAIAPPERVSATEAIREEFGESESVARVPGGSAVLEIRLIGDEAQARGTQARVSVSRTAASGRSPLPRLKQVDSMLRVSFDVEPGIALEVGVHLAHASRPVRCAVQPLGPGERRELALEIPPDNFLAWCGRAVDQDGRPIPDARVWLGSPENLLWTDVVPPAIPEPSARADAQGHFEVQAQAPEARVLRVEAHGFGWTLVPFGEGHERRELARDVVLPSRASLTVLVDEPDPRDTGAHQVTVRGEKRWSDSPPGHTLRIRGVEAQWDRTPDLLGFARFETLPAGELLRVSAFGLATSLGSATITLHLEAGEERRIDLRLASCAAVVGTVRDPDSRPLEAVELVLQPRTDGRAPLFAIRFSREWSSLTDAEGRFAFAGVPEGDWWIGPGPDSDCEPVRVPIRVQDGAVDRDLDLIVSRGLYIEGQVLAWDSEPIAAGRVFAIADGQAETRSFDLVPDGRFRLGPLAPGLHLVHVQPRGSANEDCGTVQVAGVAAGTSGVELVCPKAGILEVQLVGSRDPELESNRALISRRSDSGRTSVVHRARSETGDVIRVPHLSPGDYDLAVWTPDGRVALAAGLRVQPGRGGAPHRLNLNDGGSIRIRFHGRGDSLAVDVIQGDVLVGQTSLRSGEPATFAVHPGRARVELRVRRDGQEHLLAREVAVSAGGDPVEVVFNEQQ